jgi:hypothetical protein
MLKTLVVIVDRDREYLLGVVLPNDVVVKNLADFLRVGIPSRDLREELASSRMMSLLSSTHSSQINAVGPAMSFRTSCWLLPQNEQ